MLKCFEKVEKFALKDAEHILRCTGELVLSGLLGEALWSCVLVWVSAAVKSLFLSNDHPYFICCWYRCQIHLFLSALGPTGATVAEMFCLKDHETNNIVKSETEYCLKIRLCEITSAQSDLR